MPTLFLDVEKILEYAESGGVSPIVVGGIRNVYGEDEYGWACRMMVNALEKIGGVSLNCIHIDECYLVLGDKILKIYVEQEDNNTYKIIAVREQ